MTPERFWELVATLGGRADDATTPALDAALQETGEGEDFTDLVEELVDALLARCDVPHSHGGDAAEWIAAAVIAAGRESYDRTLAAGGQLSPADWRWEEAENLLVVGASPDSEDEDWRAGLEGDHLGISLEWKTTDVPVGVTSTYDEKTPNLLDDDPAGGHSVTVDPAWAEAMLRLDADAEFHRRRASIADVGLHLKVRESDDVELTPWPTDEVIDDVVMTLPREMLTDVDQRVDAYVAAVVELVLAVQERLGRS